MKHLQTVSIIGLSALMLLTTGCANKRTTANGEGVGYANSVARGEVGAPTYGVAEGGQIVGSQMSAVGSNNIVYFNLDSSSIRPSEYAKLGQHIQTLNNNTNQRVLLAGHADERGTREYNAALGERRANSVRDYLQTNGVNSAQIDTVSYGEERPVAQGSGEASWAQNRRVEITYNP